jgi:hypothetical protein
MLSHATAGTRARRHDDCAWNDNDRSTAVRAASTSAVAMKAGTAATLYLDNHAVRILDRRKRHGPRAACRQSQHEGQGDEFVHWRFSLHCCFTPRDHE